MKRRGCDERDRDEAERPLAYVVSGREGVRGAPRASVRQPCTRRHMDAASAGTNKATSMEVKGACGFGSSRNAFDTDVCKMTDRWPSIVKDTVPISAIVK